MGDTVGRTSQSQGDGDGAGRWAGGARVARVARASGRRRNHHSLPCFAVAGAHASRPALRLGGARVTHNGGHARPTHAGPARGPRVAPAAAPLRAPPARDRRRSSSPSSPRCCCSSRPSPRCRPPSTSSARPDVYALALIFAPLLVWFARGQLWAQQRLTGIKLTPEQFPEAYAMLVDAAGRSGLSYVPDAYVVLGNGVINAAASGHGFRRFVFINSDLLEVGGAAREPDALRFVIAHEVGHIAAGPRQLLAHPRHVRLAVDPPRRLDPEPGAGVHRRQLRPRARAAGRPLRHGDPRRRQVPRPLGRRRRDGRPCRHRAGLLRLGHQRRRRATRCCCGACTRCATGAVPAACSGARRSRGSGARPAAPGAYALPAMVGFEPTPLPEDAPAIQRGQPDSLVQEEAPVGALSSTPAHVRRRG